MIHAYALEPRLVASWGRREEFRFIRDKFGIGTPRALLELPKLSKWRRAVHDAALELGLSQEDMKRIEELFRLFSEHKHKRGDSVYDGLLSWLENAEREHDRKPFRAILATANPRGHAAVLVGHQLDHDDPRWACASEANPARTPQALAAALSSMIINCRALHLVDPHFGPENRRHRDVLEALLGLLASQGVAPEVIRVHCSDKATLAFFEAEAKAMAARLPSTITVEFVRWKQRGGGEKLHNRYVLTDLGGVMLGTGLDSGSKGETDDLVLLGPVLYRRRWSQYVDDDGTLERTDTPAPVRGTRPVRNLGKGS